MPQIQYKILDRRLSDISSKSPHEERGTIFSAGLDLRAMFETEQSVLDQPAIVLEPGEARLIPTGLSVWIGDEAYVGLIMPRSGTGHKRGLVLGNGTGVIDADYQGPLMVSIVNRSDRPQRIELGERIAQLLIVPVIRGDWRRVDEFDGVTVRGFGGFGSSGT
jgi:dUTP pyrophosphatase